MKLYDKTFLPVAFFAAWIVTWQYVSEFLRLPAFLYPTPTQIWTEYFVSAAIISEHLPVTLTEIALGFVIGAALGISAGIAIGISGVMERTVYPLAIIVKAVPVIAAAPLLTIWFGYDIWSKVAATAMITWFPMVVNTATGIKATDPVLLDLMRSFSAKGRQIFFKVRFPMALPFVFAGVKTAITLAAIGAVVGEFVGSHKGLGYLILKTMWSMRTAEMFAVFILLAIIGILLFMAVAILEKFTIPWSAASETKT